MKLTNRFWGYRLNCLVEPVFIAAKPLLNEFGIHLGLESCEGPGGQFLETNRDSKVKPLKKKEKVNASHLKTMRLCSKQKIISHKNRKERGRTICKTEDVGF